MGKAGSHVNGKETKTSVIGASSARTEGTQIKALLNMESSLFVALAAHNRLGLGADGVHTVAAQCLLQVTIITDEMLSNSITLRLANTSQERFLSLLLAQFLEGVARVLSAAREDIVIFNIQDDTDVSAGILNVSLSVAAPVAGPRGGEFFGSEELQERLYLNRSLLAHISSQDVLPFDDNICLREPCENYMKCVSVLKFDSLAPFIASDTILFRPIHPINGLRCRCPPGFTGDFCDTEIDLCYSKPCGAHGVCRSREGGYTCECFEDYTGEAMWFRYPALLNTCSVQASPETGQGFSASKQHLCTAEHIGLALQS
ncbi:hypothetical protein JZ751_017687 [Albula glossodonta]|uniref:EGF-like domain-containing protein n=1 Tax=Albula glossodonta TaxID=121402 RepID=A0A8T2PP38_9TELE|nr:hypothetical protein JZ751_017687 [Albula glossodonta]